VTFDRPEVKNAINQTLHHEIAHALAALDVDDE
jgi:enoyl-CoA hydratase/carnithine racemase